jgi:hypothetical protein
VFTGKHIRNEGEMTAAGDWNEDDNKAAEEQSELCSSSLFVIGLADQLHIT